jgi:hypothetical protein
LWVKNQQQCDWQDRQNTAIEIKRPRKFWTQILKDRDFLEDINVGRRIILKWVLETGCDSTELEQDPVLG